MQQLRNLEQAEVKYLEVLRKTRPDLVVKVRYLGKRDNTHGGGNGTPSNQELDGSRRGVRDDTIDRREYGVCTPESFIH